MVQRRLHPALRRAAGARRPLGRSRRAHETGSAAGLLNAVQQFGGTLGVAVLGTAFLHRFTADVRAHADAGSAALGAIRLTLEIAAALVAVTAVTAAFMGVREAPAGRRPIG
ncbi:hypothetical protein AB0O28_00660 [Microbispora sp. NPDC088329]|uniref:hypothetical protein n=1 Tax=Microbispora sp. NPDC088329 TaxID=3154869 RepID=UPI00342526C9